VKIIVIRSHPGIDHSLFIHIGDQVLVDVFVRAVGDDAREPARPVSIEPVSLQDQNLSSFDREPLLFTDFAKIGFGSQGCNEPDDFLAKLFR
jgi:hypothetical protein